MEEKNMTEKESLALITNMIQSTQRSIESTSGKHFLVWGYLTTVVTLAVWWVVKETGDPMWQWLFMLIPLIGGFWLLFQIRKEKIEKVPQNFVGKIIGYIWMTFGITMGLTSFMTGVLYSFGFAPTSIPVLFMVVLLAGMGTALTGMVARYKVFIVSGVLGILLSVVCLFVHGIDGMLVCSLAFILIMIVPGHIIHYKQCHHA